jgi:hypothetical protein
MRHMGQWFTLERLAWFEKTQENKESLKRNLSTGEKKARLAKAKETILKLSKLSKNLGCQQYEEEEV